MKLRTTQLLLLAGAIGFSFTNVACGGGDSGGGAGTSGGGGTTGAGGGSGGAVAPLVSYTFDTATSTDTMNWKLNDYVDGNPSKNLGAYMNGDAGLSLANPPKVEWANDDSEGSASSGSLKVTVTFTGFEQYVDPTINLATPVNLSGAHNLVRYKVKLVSGSLGTGGMQFHVSSGATYVYRAGSWVNGSSLTVGTWFTPPALDTSMLDPSGGFDAAQIVQIGLQLASGGAVDGGAPPSGPIVLEIDTIKG